MNPSSKYRVVESVQYGLYGIHSFVSLLCKYYADSISLSSARLAFSLFPLDEITRKQCSAVKLSKQNLILGRLEHTMLPNCSGGEA
jgi:hypothetical protein